MESTSKHIIMRKFGCLLLTFLMLWALSGCKSDVSATEFPPTEETVQAAVEKLGWTLDPERTQSRTEGQVQQVIYTLETEDQRNVGVSCALAEGNRILMESYIAALLPDKPQFDWADWEKAVTLAETLYGGFDEGELYQALSQQGIPEPQIPAAGPDTRPGTESLRWDVELPAGYAKVQWYISAGAVEHTFPSPVIQDWRMTFIVSLYESKEAYESMYDAVPD